MRFYTLLCVFLSAVAASTAQDAEKIIIGVVEGAIGQEFNNFYTCLSDADKIYNDFRRAISDFREKTSSSVLSGLKIIGGDIKLFRSAISSCKGITADL